MWSRHRASMKFSQLPLHPALAQTLATRGYETATSVQAAVLDPACAGRDLLVSSETGSGKTVAFGVALADTLLGPTGVAVAAAVGAAPAAAGTIAAVETAAAPATAKPA